MEEALIVEAMTGDPDRKISDTMKLERARLLNFIRKHAPDGHDAEDILQDVFYEFIEAYRLMKPIEHAGAWLFRVARNRITDLFRKKGPESLSDPVSEGESGDVLLLEDLLPSPNAGPEAVFARSVLLEELEDALSELPPEQRDVFVAHELDGHSFKQIAAARGISVNTLLSRKHYAVRFLRQRLRVIYDEFTKGQG